MAKVTEAHVEARTNQILDAALQSFAEGGYHSSTMQDIAATAGLSTGAIYLYYESKEALLRAINQRSQNMSRRVVEEARAHGGGPLGAIRALGATILMAFRDPGFDVATRLNVEVWPEALRDKELAAGFRQELKFWRQEMGRLLREGQEAGQIRADVDTDMAAAVVICAWEGLRKYKLIDPDYDERVLLSCMQGLLTDEVAGTWLNVSVDDLTTASREDLPWLVPERRRGDPPHESDGE